MKVDKVKVVVKLGKTRLSFDNLFNGQKALEQVANELINQNIDVLSQSVKPIVEGGLERKIYRIFNQALSKAPAKEFFP